eukprot:scaffold6610_cov245-Pinguiococcus_pyrenoidosus.AAC.4
MESAGQAPQRRGLGGEASSGEDVEEPLRPELAVFAPFAVLIMGAVLRQLTRELPVPYTVALLLFGIAVGEMIINFPDEDVMRSFNTLGELDPHLLLHIFLPPLIFESAFSIEWHVFNKSKWATMFLAGPGLLISMVISGAVANALFFANGIDDQCTAADSCACSDKTWSRDAGYLMGVVLSATDPVAVVALLRELGVKAELSTAIEGESLLNDGTALVVFQVLAEVVRGAREQSEEDIFRTFVTMSGGGILLGVLMGFLAVAWIGYVFNDATIEITITVCAAYMTFFLAEYFLRVSGVLAVVALGLYCGRFGRTRISPEVQHFLGEFWEMLAYFGNTLIFSIAGIVVLLRTSKQFTPWDLGVLVALYFTLLAARAAVFTLLYFLKWAAGAPPQWKDYVVSVWGGLRGAVGIALALFVWHEKTICANVGNKILFHTAGIVVFTVVINGISIRSVLDALGMNVVSHERQLVLADAYKRVAECGRHQESLLRADALFTSAVWSEVRRYYLVEDDLATDASLAPEAPRARRAAKIADFELAASGTDVDDETHLREARQLLEPVPGGTAWPGRRALPVLREQPSHRRQLLLGRVGQVRARAGGDRRAQAGGAQRAGRGDRAGRAGAHPADPGFAARHERDLLAGAGQHRGVVQHQQRAAAGLGARLRAGAGVHLHPGAGAAPVLPAQLLQLHHRPLQRHGRDRGVPGPDRVPGGQRHGHRRRLHQGAALHPDHARLSHPARWAPAAQAAQHARQLQDDRGGQRAPVRGGHVAAHAHRAASHIPPPAVWLRRGHGLHGGARGGAACAARLPHQAAAAQWPRVPQQAARHRHAHRGGHQAPAASALRPAAPVQRDQQQHRVHGGGAHGAERPARVHPGAASRGAAGRHGVLAHARRRGDAHEEAAVQPAGGAVAGQEDAAAAGQVAGGAGRG